MKTITVFCIFLILGLGSTADIPKNSGQDFDFEEEYDFGKLLDRQSDEGKFLYNI